MKYYISPPAMNPLSRLLTALVAALSLIGFFFFGLVVASILLTVLLAFGLLFWVRSLWLGRKLAVNRAPLGPAGQQGEVIDAEYTLVHRRRE
ncbi:MAG: hypothetical protein EXR85_00780 [Xanthomonadales bacterium]|nr:hypothetical protein [Xanthomonadales bacterium]